MSPTTHLQFDTKEATEKAHSLFHQDKFAEAAHLYKKILQHSRNDFLVWGNLGISLRDLNQYHAAACCLRRAHELRPTSAKTLAHYGLCLMFLNRKEEALQALEKATRINPNDFTINIFYAGALQEFGAYDEALHYFNVAATIEPENPRPLNHRSEVLLRLGRFQEAWDDFENRWHSNSSFKIASPIAKWDEVLQSPRWQGEDLTGKTILVCWEQGFGDTILFIRYLDLLKKKGCRVLLDCQPQLQRLFKTVAGIDSFVSAESRKERVDYHIPLMSLPRLFQTEVSTIPPIPSLYAPDSLPLEVKEVLEVSQGRFKVGIVWSGSPSYLENQRRATPFTRFLSLAEIPGVQLYSLQKGPQEKELSDASAQGIIPELAPYLDDFSDTAAVLKQLDLIIMTDTSVAHLAGSLNIPVWNLLPYRAYWVYLTEREDSPWYSSMRLFRQPTPGDWDSVFARVKTELEKVVKMKKSGEQRVVR